MPKLKKSISEFFSLLGLKQPTDTTNQLTDRPNQSINKQKPQHEKHKEDGWTTFTQNALGLIALCRGNRKFLCGVSPVPSRTKGFVCRREEIRCWASTGRASSPSGHTMSSTLSREGETDSDEEKRERVEGEGNKEKNP